MSLFTATELNAGDSSRASHVWRVDSVTGTEVYRRPWWSEPQVSAFMLGLNRLFGADPRDLQATADTYRFWRCLNIWHVPEPLGTTEFQGMPALRMEFIPGEPSRDINDADARDLGRRVARIHSHSTDQFGDVLGKASAPLMDFYVRAWDVVREVVPLFQAPNWRAHWATAQAAFASAPCPSGAAPMLLDWNGTQFVWHGGQPYALVDVEASVLAPVELDLCLWELLLKRPRIRQFMSGYTEIRPLPNLTPHRTACRLLLLALEVEGSPAPFKWLRLSPHFDDAVPSTNSLRPL
ncbi:hypothetical protein [uncultured Deinococcus sp.]|uniref:hypothetical protein n=1 Tax=uncultured Deinococcus sp. TaxID=158789 RepID=UPI002600A554|nr:hypothetical protein [uncultured Deinococcus sp.]